MAEYVPKIYEWNSFTIIVSNLSSEIRNSSLFISGNEYTRHMEIHASMYI